METSLGYMVSLSQNKTNSKDARSMTGVGWRNHSSPEKRRMVEDAGVKSEGEMLR